MATATTATVSAPPARSALSASALPRRRAPRTTGKQTLLRAVRAEWLKIRTLRSTWITSLLAIALTVLFGAGIAVGYAHAPGKEAAAAHVIGAGSTFGQIAAFNAHGCFGFKARGRADLFLQFFGRSFTN